MDKREALKIPDNILKEIKNRYKNGDSIPKLVTIYGYSYKNIRFNIKKIKQLEYSSIKEGLIQIKIAEDRLISGTFPNYKFMFPINTQNDLKDYESLKNYYMISDLNNKFF